ncbi:MAG: hypothetical protein R2911_24995 [Caldilineaceae bacterium]
MASTARRRRPDDLNSLFFGFGSSVASASAACFFSGGDRFGFGGFFLNRWLGASASRSRFTSGAVPVSATGGQSQHKHNQQR